MRLRAPVPPFQRRHHQPIRRGRAQGVRVALRADSNQRLWHVCRPAHGRIWGHARPDGAGDRLYTKACLAASPCPETRNEFCSNCLSEDIEWIEASGKGAIHTFSVVQRPPGASFTEDIPYVVAIIDVDEGPRMISNMVEIAPEDMRVGMPVRVVFENITDDIALPKFRPMR
ncbi:MAG: OB-fold domain-containing protein [Candidatus Hydrogenedentota bacterium]|nr:MAG: OB-fold domain-containing protein [Candidatus Hydrogenedentota bacterium]